LELNELIRLQEQYLILLESYKRLATANYANGKGNMVDVIRVEILLNNAATELSILRDKQLPLAVTFNRLLNRPDSTTILIADSLLAPQTVQEYNADSILARNPKLIMIDQQHMAAIATEKVANKQGLPSFGIGLDYAIVTPRTDVDIPDNGRDILMPMVTMSLPVFRKKYNASVREAQLTQLALEQERLELSNNLITEFEDRQYRKARNLTMLELYNDQIEKTQLVIDLLYTGYANSGKEFEEILRMEQQLLQYKIARVSVIANYYIAQARLDYLTAK